jgi:peptidoglycan/xylan/chitin deacetylase (PgdA/CDA1 family)
MFRAPYGDYNNSLINVIDFLKMYCVQWNIDSMDWKNRSCEQMTKKIVSKLTPGSIILLHNGAKYTPEALPLIIEKIQKENFKIVPISQIIYKKNYQIIYDGTQMPLETVPSI